MTANKKTRTPKPKTAAATPTTTTAVGADPLPVEVAPTAPSTFVVQKGAVPRGNKPKVAQVQLAPALATELVAEESVYETAFGPSAPSCSDLAASLTLGVGWSQEKAAAQRWYAYCQAQEARAWQGILGAITVLRPAVTYALTVDSALPRQLPTLMKFMSAAVPAGKKAARTKAAKKAAAANATTTVTATAVATPTTPTTPTVVH